MKTRLYKSEDNKVFLGVCGGLAEYFDVDSVLVRVVVFVTICFSNWLGILTYILVSILLPVKPKYKGSSSNDNGKFSNATKNNGYSDVNTDSGNTFKGENQSFNGNTSYNTGNYYSDFKGYRTQNDFYEDYKKERNASGSGTLSVTLGLIMVSIGTVFLIDKYFPIMNKASDFVLPIFFILMGGMIIYKTGKKAENE